MTVVRNLVLVSIDLVDDSMTVPDPTAKGAERVVSCGCDEFIHSERLAVKHDLGKELHSRFAPMFEPSFIPLKPRGQEVVNDAYPETALSISASAVTFPGRVLARPPARDLTVRPAGGRARVVGRRCRSILNRSS
jgi:hypothetical protein